ncbi:MAG: GTP 3',8-cyclase MoaA [Anaerocolumna sp.]
MTDQHGRKIDYMRISVTDRCNLRCNYCMPKDGIECLDHRDILTYEEIDMAVEAAAGLGIRKIKITGGEPLVRKGIVNLVHMLKNIQGIKEVTMTSNGILLKDMAKGLQAAGLDGINISLDTLDRDKFKQLTRYDKLGEVLQGIDEAIKTGIKTKLNCLPVKDFNEDELIKIAELANNGIDVRFIEMMPIGLGKGYQLIPYQKVKEKLEASYGDSVISTDKHGNGPAIYYDFEGLKGSIGFITAMSNEFCGDCNRIRLTAEGELKLCLHYNEGIFLKPYLRNQISMDKLQFIMEEAIRQKPAHHCFHDRTVQDAEQRKMVQIGG